MDVLDDDHQRTFGREVFQRPPHGPEDLLSWDRIGERPIALARRDASNGPSGTPSSSRTNFSMPHLGRVAVRDVGCRVKQLPHWPVRDGLAVGQATAAQHGSATGRATHELAYKATFADASGTDDRDASGPAQPQHVREDPLHPPELGIPANKAGSRRTGHRRDRASRRDEADRGDRSRLSLGADGGDLFHHHRVADKKPGRSTEEDLARGAACSSRAAVLTASPVTRV